MAMFVIWATDWETDWGTGGHNGAQTRLSHLGDQYTQTARTIYNDSQSVQQKRRRSVSVTTVIHKMCCMQAEGGYLQEHEAWWPASMYPCAFRLAQHLSYIGCACAYMSPWAWWPAYIRTCAFHLTQFLCYACHWAFMSLHLRAYPHPHPHSHNHPHTPGTAQQMGTARASGLSCSHGDAC
eukprot:1159059-Pelagomonas_calceolata.AAC.1